MNIRDMYQQLYLSYTGFIYKVIVHVITLEYWIEDGQADLGNEGDGFQAGGGEGEEVDDGLGDLPQAVGEPGREHRVWNVNVAFEQLKKQLEKISFLCRRKLSSLSSVKVSRLLSSLSLFWLLPSSSLSLLEIPDGVENFICGLSECESSKLSRQWVVWRAVQRVELGGEEPGKGGEDKVEHVLPDVDHDVVVQPKSVGNRVPVLI